MNFHQLHIFYTVAERGSFSAAAQALHMSQPAVTMQVQALEEYFGTKLLIRSTKRMELSEAGRTLLPFARRSLELSQATDAAMAAFSNKLQGRLQLGASLTIGEYVLPRLLGPFGREYPDISIMLKVMNTTQILEEIASHQLNFGLIEAPVEHPDMVLDAVMEDELKLIVPSSHPLAQREDAIYLKDVLTYPFVLREKGSGTRKVMEDVLLERGHDPESIQTVMELGSTGAVKSAVEEGLGITMLSTSTVKHETALGLVKMIDIADASFKRNFYSIHLRSALLPMSAMTFLAYLRERRR
ncbi:DNA-binding transcriptional regulator, LysR family [Paenibacillus sp. cl141a]|uniref:selenium metabolism-associated LysR family transcriptional regulator n=1 Tax=Bacillales TaxID=1385 RepID=UPI000178A286|nr:MULTISPECIES: selenium metabolism-associated LysR family transcriptional regulator [Paenibacillus]ACX64220.1 transcriptional regulator, LysR family [Paenibacillus sp. Y412MC10]ETT57202.1 LysR family transcriptional regulator [Paenibacillus sp. FSL H8-457]MCM3256545.1 selenium metabolism-associated LysR family transcriptional regulator [Paenibacillus lautus]PCL94473.1 LysR family transcriptional regulator [Paenibacillus lautus]QOT07639.1 LysR family transcriptional regulator [Paenibacillus s